MVSDFVFPQLKVINKPITTQVAKYFKFCNIIWKTVLNVGYTGAPGGSVG